jgi:hypothetical protein
VRGSRWLIFAPVAILALFSSVTHAEPIQGLNTTYYTIDEIPPVQSITEYEECGSELENNINRSYDGEPFEDCTGDLFMVHMTGFIEIPEHETIKFWLASDDGGEATIGGNTWGSWTDQGCSAWQSGNLTLQAGSVPLEVWMYENGGGTCLMLAWKIDDNDWEIVPDEAFSTLPFAPTTTTVSQTTTTLESTTTTTIEQSTTTSVPTTTSSTSTTTSSTSTSMVVSTTTTTEYVAPPAPQPPATVQLPPTTEPAPPDTEPIPPVTEPVQETIPLEPPSTEPESPDTLPKALYPPDTEVPAPAPPEEVFDAPTGNEEGVLEPEEALFSVFEDSDASAEEIVDAVEALLESDLTSDQALEIVFQPAVLSNITADTAEQLFDQIVPSELSSAEIQQITEAIQEAPTEIREAFESSIDIFGDGFDNYEPVGSTISVAQRRAVVAVTAVLLAIPAPVPQRRRL